MTAFAMRWLPRALLCALAVACSQPPTMDQAKPPAGPAPIASSPAPSPAPEVAPAAAPTVTSTDPARPGPAAPRPAKALFGNGCFWCSEAVLEQLDGVLDVTSGYAGGTVANPTYQEVCSGMTGHAEVVEVTFDPARITYEQLLEWFFHSHDPTTLNRQGNDVGTQYRSVVFYADEAQHQAAQAAIAKAQHDHRDPIVTQVVPWATFYPAEDYHQDYYRSHQGQPYCRATIAPKLQKLGLDVQGKVAPRTAPKPANGSDAK